MRASRRDFIKGAVAASAAVAAVTKVPLTGSPVISVAAAEPVLPINAPAGQGHKSNAVDLVFQVTSPPDQLKGGLAARGVEGESMHHPSKNSTVLYVGLIEYAGGRLVEVDRNVDKWYSRQAVNVEEMDYFGQVVNVVSRAKLTWTPARKVKVMSIVAFGAMEGYPDWFVTVQGLGYVDKAFEVNVGSTITVDWSGTEGD